MKIAFFDTKPYDIPGFEQFSAGTDLELKFFETKLNADTGDLQDHPRIRRLCHLCHTGSERFLRSGGWQIRQGHHQRL